jgi:integrase
MTRKPFDPAGIPAAADRHIRLYAASRRSHWSPKNVANAVYCLNRAQGWLAARGVDLLDAEPVDLMGYLGDLLDIGRSPNTVIVNHRQLKSFYAWLAEDPGDGMAYIARNPMLRVRAPKPVEPDQDRTRIAEEWQFRALLATCRQAKDKAVGRKHCNDLRDAAIILLLWHTGIRRGEAANLELRHLDFDTQMLHLARTKGRGKTRSRSVFVPDEAFEAILKYLRHRRGDHDGPLFESTGYLPGSHTRRRGITDQAISLLYKRRCELANATQKLPEPLDITCHPMRRAAARDWIAAGGSVTTLETNHGWKHDGRMAGTYTRQAATELAADDARRIAEVRAGRARHLRAVGD